VTHETVVPPAVMQALETLEHANSPAELGRPYQALLDWRRHRSFDIFVRNASLPALIMTLLGAIYVITSFMHSLNTEFVRGLQVGLIIAALVGAIQSKFRPRAELPLSVPARIEAAIDRWRHAVPAMRELPR